MKSQVIYEDEATRYLKIAYPTAPLRPYVEYFFEVLQPATLSNPLYLTGLPSLNGLLCVVLNDRHWLSFHSSAPTVQSLKGSRFLGPISHLFTSIYPEGTHQFLVKFKPGMMGRFFGFPDRELENGQVDLSYLAPGEPIDDLLRELPDFQSRVNRIEFVLLDKLPNLKSDYRFELVQRALHYFQSAPGHAGVSDVSRQLPVTYPSLYRYFTEELGYSPKYCQRLIRFKKAYRLYKLHGSIYPFEEAGYTDFSHFVRETRLLTTKVPSEL
ncbi:helix-turn-helix domain-containing protein [Larkinella soli]|uniref:helix-turn-helix domain-containing protein n=1 Tax=Larkinella soli TaxID=1770527 RepID=UPI000FFB06E0|nr:DUF6597 domain-containing transcriptional factor [Larkinella soli]